MLVRPVVAGGDALAPGDLLHQRELIFQRLPFLLSIWVDCKKWRHNICIMQHQGCSILVWRGRPLKSAWIEMTTWEDVLLTLLFLGLALARLAGPTVWSTICWRFHVYTRVCMVDVAPSYVVVSIHICLKAYFDFIICGNDDDGDDELWKWTSFHKLNCCCHPAHTRPGWDWGAHCTDSHLQKKSIHSICSLWSSL